jgi:hypothetical protein
MHISVSFIEKAERILTFVRAWCIFDNDIITCQTRSIVEEHKNDNFIKDSRKNSNRARQACEFVGALKPEFETNISGFKYL